MRIGHGFDVHKFTANKKLIICGVNIPYKYGLFAHSDGDVALHALINAILGAAALGDIGLLFPNNNPKYKNISSRVLLQETYSMIINKGYIINNIDITIIAENPKISPYVLKMKTNIMNDLNCDFNHINIKSTTTETLGFIGRKEGIAAEAIILLKNTY
uniref:2-C-methyl-D-erythritol 2,4-cyclodiphosphate synthase n=1 Tax=Candidatus Aschnera chinzeii TaxID=1485666 RepID=A0AAT9G569_9ENTR|nr:MAG: 2-C-methyl-D-erythritol 2,4-cyclodiphosphate synthase [Candidatus Aschnera chinzeii]